MDTINLIVGLALIQFMFFGVMVGRARAKYGVVAPATTGHPMFERYFRVQMNTLELLVGLVPSLYTFNHYYPSSYYVPLFGAAYLIGRILYFYTYIRDPNSRSLGFVLSVIPILALIVSTVAGALKGLL